MGVRPHPWLSAQRWADGINPVNTTHLYNNCTTRAQRLQRWPNIVQMLYRCFVFIGKAYLTSNTACTLSRWQNIRSDQNSNHVPGWAELNWLLNRDRLIEIEIIMLSNFKLRYVSLRTAIYDFFSCHDDLNPFSANYDYDRFNPLPDNSRF